MTLKVRFLDIRQLKALSKEIKHIASESLKETLADYISSTRDGNYLCNIFNPSEMMELEELASNYHLLALM